MPVSHRPPASRPRVVRPSGQSRRRNPRRPHRRAQVLPRSARQRLAAEAAACGLSPAAYVQWATALTRLLRQALGDRPVDWDSARACLENPWLQVLLQGVLGTLSRHLTDSGWAEATPDPPPDPSGTLDFTPAEPTPAPAPPNAPMAQPAQPQQAEPAPRPPAVHPAQPRQIPAPAQPSVSPSSARRPWPYPW
ncbi:MAG: hypothetical protein K6T26_04925 [Alicyclobacillus sp.]|nr:hypothetical protein [Alicyclobacillus sp.]